MSRWRYQPYGKAVTVPMDEQQRTERDLRLVAAARAGDIEAYNQLVTSYQRQVYGVCLRMLGDRDAAEDGAQETFMRAYTRLETFRGGQFRLWLLRVATNICHDMLRRRRRRPAVSLSAAGSAGRSVGDDLDAGDPPLGDSLLRHELSAALAGCLARLPEAQRAIVILSDIEGLAYSEIAAVLGLPVGTVKSRLSRARGRLRDLLRGEDLLPARYRAAAAGGPGKAYQLGAPS